MAAIGCVDGGEPFQDPDTDSSDGGAPAAVQDFDSLSPVGKLDACEVPEAHGKIVLGYAPSWGDFVALTARLDFDTLTHVALAFTNPTAEGETTELPWVKDAELHDMVSQAHAKGVKVIASVGGAAESDLVRAKLDPAEVDDYVEELAGFLEKFDLDGIDVDIEGGVVDQTYAPFVQKLAARIRPEGKLISAAVAQWFQDGVVDEALFCFDFINEMSYDAAGGWSDPDEHASRAFARTRARYWSADREYPAERVVIGVPFYGYCWGNGCYKDGHQIPFRVIEEQFPDQLDADWIHDEENDITINFNGVESIEYKTELSKDYGGIMIWDMSQDGSDDQLFDAIRRNL